VFSGKPHPAPRETEPVRTTGRNLLRDLPIEYAKRVKAKAALLSAAAPTVPVLPDRGKAVVENAA